MRAQAPLCQWKEIDWRGSLLCRQAAFSPLKGGGGRLPEWVENHRALAARVETSGDTAFFYCRDAAPLLAALSGAGGLRYLHRAANLEDVFIKLTGRELRD